MVSFIVPLNQRKLDRLPGLFRSIRDTYSDLEYEIVVAEQAQDEPFKLGQMRNLGFKKAVGDIIVFIDVDIRFKYKIDFVKELEARQKPLVCWRNIIQVDELDDGTLIERGAAREGRGTGGFIAQTRKQFEDSCGYSNLFIGWGKEDDLLFKFRYVSRERLIEDIYHVAHVSDRKLWGTTAKAVAHNRKMLVSDNTRRREWDGFAQTVAKEKEVPCEGVRHFLFSKVGVPESFEYMGLYQETLKFVGGKR